MEIFALFIAVILGIVLVVIIKPKNKIISLLLTFSGAYLLSITLLKLFPEIYMEGGKMIGFYVIIGLVFQLVLDFFSKGAEHGHVHSLNTKLFPWALFISLCIHSFMEGLPLGDHQHTGLLWAIVIHKVPIAMVLASFLLYYESNKIRAIIFLVLFAIMSPLGVFLSGKLPLLIRYSIEINAVVGGVFLHIATIILFEASKDHRFNILKFSTLLLGVIVALLLV